MKPIVVTKKDNLEKEINSGAMTRLAGVPEHLSNATNIHMAIANIPTEIVEEKPSLGRQDC
tara:strand:- start:280 stop:462 length:183 start_codon:yes stop_codon:yes gene_type:complete